MLFKKHYYRNKEEQTIQAGENAYCHISVKDFYPKYLELLRLNDKNKMEKKKIIKDLSAKKYVYGLPVSMSKDVVAVQSLSCDSTAAP